jgi:hypothetical protein
MLCRKCGAEVPHECSPSALLSRPVISCPLKGAVWVYVTDYGGDGVHGASVTLDGKKTTTDPSGFTSYDPVDEGSPVVAVEGKFEGKLKQFYLPETHQITAAATKGQVSLVEFQLPCWIEVRVEDDKGVVVDDVEVVVKDAGGTRVEKLTKERLGGDGVYRIEKLFPGTCEISIPGLSDAEWTAKV